MIRLRRESSRMHAKQCVSISRVSAFTVLEFPRCFDRYAHAHICIYISWRQRQMMHIKRSETRTRSPTGNNALMSRRRSDYGGFTLVIVISRRARVAAERETDFYRFFRSTSRDSPVQQSEIFSSCVFFFVRFDPINYFVISNSRKNCSYT